MVSISEQYTTTVTINATYAGVDSTNASKLLNLSMCTTSVDLAQISSPVGGTQRYTLLAPELTAYTAQTHQNYCNGQSAQTSSTCTRAAPAGGAERYTLLPST
jgi:hypothetical protein